MEITPYQLAETYVGVEERDGAKDNPHINAWLEEAGYASSIVHDEIPWCGAFVNHIANRLRLKGPVRSEKFPHNHPARARSWLTAGTPIALADAEPGFDVVILRRGLSSPSADVLDAPGHVGFFSALRPGLVLLLGGNQGDAVSVGAFDQERILGVRRLA